MKTPANPNVTASPNAPAALAQVSGSTDSMRQRIHVIASVAETSGNPRFRVFRSENSVLILLDSYDTASCDGDAMGYCSQRVELAEYILGIRSNAAGEPQPPAE